MSLSLALSLSQIGVSNGTKRSETPSPTRVFCYPRHLSTIDLASFSKLVVQNSLWLTSWPSAPPRTSSASLIWHRVSRSMTKTQTLQGMRTRTSPTTTPTGRFGGADSFKTYSNNRNLPVDSFRRYNRGSTGHNDKFKKQRIEWKRGGP